MVLVAQGPVRVLKTVLIVVWVWEMDVRMGGK